MARPTTPMKQTCTRHSQAAEQLDLHASQLYEKQQSQSSSEREQSLAKELAIVKKAAAYFAKSLN